MIAARLQPMLQLGKGQLGIEPMTFHNKGALQLIIKNQLFLMINQAKDLQKMFIFPYQTTGRSLWVMAILVCSDFI